MPRIQTSVRLKPTSIYFFRYNNPSTKVSVWDKAPLVMPLDIGGKSMLGLNIHWIPARMRTKFVLMLLEYAEKVVSKRQTRLLPRLVYTMIKNGPFKFVGMAIRRYHLNRITSIKEIPPEFWTQLKHSDGRYQARKVKRKP